MTGTTDYLQIAEGEIETRFNYNDQTQFAISLPVVPTTKPDGWTEGTPIAPPKTLNIRLSREEALTLRACLSTVGV